MPKSGRTEELILEVQTKLNLSREQVLTQAPVVDIVVAGLGVEKPFGGFLKALLKDKEAGNNSSPQEIMAQQMQKDFDKHPESKTIMDKVFANQALIAKVSQALEIISDPKELGYDATTSAFDANKAAAVLWQVKEHNPQEIQALSEEVKAGCCRGRGSARVI